MSGMFEPGASARCWKNCHKLKLATPEPQHLKTGCSGQSGFWRRVFEDYESRQVTVEVKNYIEIGRDDFRQMLSYLSGAYGRFGIIVYRTESEGMTDKERAWLQEIWHEHKRIVFTVPISMVRRFISKLRTVRKHDYTDAALNKRLDTFERSYVAIKHSR